jgi:uncharacterized protein (TIGR00297 family)
MLKWFLAYGWTSSLGRLGIAVGVTIGFALLARLLRGVDRSGMIAGGAACFLLFMGAGPAGLAVLGALFLLTWVSTRFGYRRKQELGVAERGDGRNAWQVLANLAIPALTSTAFSLIGNRAWLVATAAALAEAATDTIASEIGQTGSHTARLITTWNPVPAGADGGITVSGTVAGTAAGLAIASVAAWGGMILWSELWIPWLAGFLGMVADSVMGSTVQRRGGMNNEAVNFVSTALAAVLGYGFMIAVMN